MTSGTLDNGFWVNGHVVTHFEPGPSTLQKIIALPGGKILAVGYTDHYDPVPNDHDFYQFALARYNSDGSLDTTLDGDGIVTNPIMGGRGARAYDVVAQPDGKFVVAGVGSLQTTNFVAARFNVNGSLDTTFSDDGIFGTYFNGSGGAYCVALQSDGKIVIGGVGNIGYKMVVTRLDANGNIDSGFADFGQLIFSGEYTLHFNRMTKLAVLPDGKIMVVGTTEREMVDWISLNRFNPDGTFDTSFDGNGQMLTELVEGAYDCQAKDFTIQSDGKLVLAATCWFDGNQIAAVSARIQLNGALDRQFADKGTLIRATTYGSYSVVSQSDGKLIFTAAGPVHFFLARHLNNGTRESDFDNDRVSDISVFRPSAGSWYLLNSAAGFSSVQFGNSDDRIVPADFDGDGRIDVSVFRAGDWYSLRSSDNTLVYTRFGQGGDTPVPADFDGDSKADIAVFRQGVWFIINSHDGSVHGEQFGQPGDRPVVGNFDGDLRADLAVYRNGNWYVNGSTTGFAATKFGIATDRPVPGDYDSDGQTDYAVYRDGTWYLQQSFAGFSAIQFGIASDRPAPADFDGDGRTDPAVYRDGTWYILGTASGLKVSNFGLAEDVPVPSAFVP